MGATTGGPGRPTGKTASELAEAMLLAVGELGYDAASVEIVLVRRDMTRSDFHRYFTDKQACFARGCADAWESVCDKLVPMPAGTPRQERLESVLLALLRLAGDFPTATRALLTGTHVAGSVALEARSATITRLVDTLDGGRSHPQTPHPHRSTFGELIVGAIEGAIVRPLCAGEELDPDRLLPELLQFLSIYQRGDPAKSGRCWG